MLVQRINIEYVVKLKKIITDICIGGSSSSSSSSSNHHTTQKVLQSWWESLVIQGKYQEEEACDKRQYCRHCHHRHASLKWCWNLLM